MNSLWNWHITWFCSSKKNKIMWRNYLKVAFRILVRYKMFSLLNILGLSIGFSSCVIIFLFVNNELSYDKFHKDYERIYRVEKISKIYGKKDRYAKIPAFIGNELPKYQEIEAIGRFSTTRASTMRYKDKVYKEMQIIHMEPELFDVLSFQVLKGNVNELTRPYTVALCETNARKYFLQKNPIGKIIEIDTTSYEVVAILKDAPRNTHAKYQVIISMRTTEQMMHSFPEEMRLFWHQPTYIKLHRWVNPEDFEKKISNLAHELKNDKLKEMGESIKCVLRPIQDIHLHSNSRWEVDTPGNISMVYGMIAIGLLILLTSCFNFINLSTAKYVNRSGEVGVRKTFGASRLSLIIQFLNESLILTLIAHIISMFLVEFFIPLINNAIDANLILENDNYKIYVFNFMLIMIIGILAGAYPAFFLSALKPAKILKTGWSQGKKGFSFRKLLVAAQFAISISLIIMAIIINKQLIYMKNKPMGFDIDNKLVFEFPENKVNKDNLEMIKSEFEIHSGITASTISSSIPGRWRYFWRLWPTGDQENNVQMVNCLQGDYDFIPIYGLKVIAGQSIIEGQSSESNRGWIFNEAAIKIFGWKSFDEALRKTMGQRETPIRGIFKDYNFKGLQNEVEPLAFFEIQEDYRYITLVYNTDKVAEVLDFANNKFSELFPDAALDYFFLDKDFENQYFAEERMSRLINIFTFLGIFIACIGFFGMTLFIVENRKKEIGIRKILGSPARSLHFLFINSFSRWILLGFIIAVPLSIIATNKWLEDFAYKTEISWWIFPVAVLLIFVIAMLTAIFQTNKAINTNPVESLRYE
jgi:putative ABC transport system permease protein